MADYVDFYCSLDHATNLGRMFRPDAEPLLPNWRHLPVGYHGRAGHRGGVRHPDRPAVTGSVGGRGVLRAVGQARHRGRGRLRRRRRRPRSATRPAGAFDDHVFGVVLVNDWSARDIQAWEYVPLGPVPRQVVRHLDLAVDHAAGGAAPPGSRAAPQDPEPLDYLRRPEPWGLDLSIEVALNGEVVSRPPFATMYWTPDQMLAHMTVNGASLRTGDLFASRHVSGAEPRPARLADRADLERHRAAQAAPTARPATFLEDGDTVTIRATAGGRSLGEVSGTIR